MGTRHQAVGGSTRKSKAQVRSSSGRPSPSMSLYGWQCSHFGILALISRQSASASARRGSSSALMPGGGDGRITSQQRKARASGSTDISACISVVPARGRSAERRVGDECVGPCSSRRSPDHYKTIYTTQQTLYH